MKTICTLAAAAMLGAFLRAPASGQGRFTAIYNFDGAEAVGLAAANGVFYTITAGTVGCGSIVTLNPPASAGGAWTETTLYTFTGINGDGCGPIGPPTIAPDGTLYGVTSGGGVYMGGTVYKLQPSAKPGGVWTESVLYSFPFLSAPFCLIIGPHGGLYVGSWSGGAYGGGFLFELQRPASQGGPWTGSVLYSFPDLLGPGAPVSMILGPDGVFYGTIPFGGSPPRYAGAVFELTPPAEPGGVWTESILCNFRGGADGSFPNSLTLAGDGGFYGTTFGTTGSVPYNTPYGIGTVFKLMPPSTPGGSWTKTILAQVGAGDFRGPTSPVLMHNGRLYGSTSAGPSVPNPEGVVYELTPPSTPGGAWTTIYLHSFTGTTPGYNLVIDQHGTLYGTTQTDISPYTPPPQGIVYKIALE